MEIDQSYDYDLVTSTRFDHFLSKFRWNDDAEGPCPFLLLRYHFDRLIEAAERHSWSNAKESLTYDKFRFSCQAAFANSVDEGCKIDEMRITLSQRGKLTISASPLPLLSSDPTLASFFSPTSDSAIPFAPVFSIYVDSQPTLPSLFTSTKTTYRAMYHSACSRANLPPLLDPTNPADVLMYNAEGLVTETSIFNVAFFHSPYWITPSVSTGCLSGVLRRWLLEQGRIREDVDSQLTKDGLQDGDWILLFNGVQGCKLGQIKTIPKVTPNQLENNTVVVMS